MKISTTRFGEIEIGRDMVIDFPQGLEGHDLCKKYFLIDYMDIVKWLHAAEDPDVAFISANPFNFFPSYAFTIGDHIEDYLGLREPEDVAVLVLLSLHGDRVTANLNKPILINVSNRKAVQIDISDMRYQSKTPLPLNLKWINNR